MNFLPRSLITRRLIFQFIGLSVALGILFAYQYMDMRHAAYHDLERSADAIVDTLRETISADPHTLTDVDGSLSAPLRRLVATTPRIVRLSVVDSSLKLVADSTFQAGGITDQTTTVKLLQAEGEDGFYYVRNGKEYYRFSESIVGNYDPQRKSNVIGVVSIELDASGVLERLDATFTQYVWLALVLQVVLLIISYLSLHFNLAIPLRQIARAALRLGQGYYHERIAMSPLIEVGEVAQAFNQMADHVERTRRELRDEVQERRQAEEAAQAAHAKLTEWVEEMKRRNERIAIVNEMGDLLQSCHTLDEAYPIIQRSLTQLFPTESGAMYLLSPSKDVVEAIASWGGLAADEASFARDECWAMRRGRAHRVDDIKNNLLCAHIHNPRDDCLYLCLPMIAGGDALGLLHLRFDLKTGAEGVDAQQQQLALTAAEHIALALSNLNLREVLLQQSIRDPLTKLFNRRYMEETLTRETHRAKRNDTLLGLIMLDVDHFKQFNDTYGHEAGDAVLKNIAHFMKTHSRGEDIPCRYGGEEFTLILPGASLEDTRLRAEQMREGAHDLRVVFGTEVLPSITISLGVAVFPTHGSNGEAALQVADAALYKAKQNGRNRVEVAG